MQQLIDFLELNVTKNEGENRLCECPSCNGENKLSINITTGKWRCFRDCGKGQPYQLIKLCKPDMEPADIFKKLKELGMGGGTRQRGAGSPNDKDIRWVTKKCTVLSKEDLQEFAKSKSLPEEALRKLSIVGYEKGKIIIPAFCPDTMLKRGVSGVLIASVDGSDVETKDGGVRYQNQGNHGLVALPWLVKQSKKEPLVYTEGWGDAVAAISAGVQATASISGCGSWDKWGRWGSFFAGRDVWVVFDRDAAGQQYEQARANAIAKTAKSVHVVHLPFEYQEKKGKDLKDWVAENSDKDVMAMLAECEVEFEPEAVVVNESENEAPVVDETYRIPVLESDDVDVVAAGFEDWSRKACGCMHKYHNTDGWSIFCNNRYQLVVTDEKGRPCEIESYIRKFLLLAKWRKVIKGKKDEGDEIIDAYFENKHKTKNFIENILVWLRDMDGVHLMPSQAAPCSLDGSLNKETTLAVRNGILNWGVYPHVLTPHTPEFYTHNYLDYDYVEGAVSDLWDNFMATIMESDSNMMELLENWMGYCLMNSTAEQKFVLSSGEGGTGKSVYCDILTALLGQSNVSAVPLNKFDDAHHITTTYGKLLNISEEAESSLEQSIESRLKHYTGGTVFQFKPIWKAPFSAYPTAKVMIVTNNIVSFKDTTDGVWRRMIMIPFKYKIPEGEIDRDLAKKIKENEMPGVLNAALLGARKVRTCGLLIPDKCAIQMEKFRKEAVPEIQFLEENFMESDGYIECETFRSMYSDWVKEMGVGEKSQKNVNVTMRKMFPGFIRKRQRVSGILKWVYYGIVSLSE